MQNRSNYFIGALTRRSPKLAKPDSGQLDAVLAAVKAWPGEGAMCGGAYATASLDGTSERRRGRGRSGRRNGL
jgi:hypothetical protein